MYREYDTVVIRYAALTYVRCCDNITGRPSDNQVEHVTTSMSRLNDMLLHVVIRQNLFEVLDTTGVWQVEVEIEVSRHEDIEK